MEKVESNTSAKRVPSAQVKPKVSFSLVWIIPLTAALIGAWLLYKFYNERGLIIDITFDESAGIEENKTPIRYKNVVVGKVTSLGLNTDLNKVQVKAEIFSPMAENLGSKTRFWVVKPRISFQGVSGLDTLLSGVHIGIDPGVKGELLTTYNGLPEPPFISNDEGTRITLKAKNLDSLRVGSPVYYHKVEVGEVTSFRLSPITDKIDVFIYVREPFDKKIKSNTRFWNASGIELDLNASGVAIHMQAIASLIIGGIAFETPESRSNKDIGGDSVFKLFENYDLAKDNRLKDNKLFYEMYFNDSLHGLKRRATVEFSGVKVGQVERIRLKKADDARLKAVVKVSLNIDKFSREGDSKEAEELLRDLVSDGLVAQLTVDSLITGAQYISLNIPKTKPLLAAKGKPEFMLKPTDRKNSARFPTTAANTDLLNFDPTEITQELSKTLASVTELLSSNDIKKILSGLASTTDSLSRISQQLDKEGFSGELVATLSKAKTATEDISRLILDSRSTIGKIGNATEQIQKDTSQSIKTFNNVANKLQQDISITLNSISQTSNTLDKSLKDTLGEDSALQYRLQVLINDLSEAAKSFSTLADTIQRKPNAVIFGK